MTSLRALIVDDEPLARRRLIALLKDEPEIEIAGECDDGPSAVAAAKRLAPDIMFLDVQMPGMTGFEVLRALKGGQTLAKTLAMAADFRRSDDETPIVLMGYYNPIYIYGVERFLADAKAAGIDGLIVVDLPPEMDAELCVPALRAGVNFIRLATPTTDDRRLPKVLENTSGFVYYVSMTGITGSALADTAAVAEAVTRIKGHTSLPVCVGFGVKTPEQAHTIGGSADGVVVGTAIVNAIAGALGPKGEQIADPAAAVAALVSGLAEGVRSARLAPAL